MEKTLVIIKPDGVQRGLVGEVVARFERRGLKLAGMKSMQISTELARKHYAVHGASPFRWANRVYHLGAGRRDGAGRQGCHQCCPRYDGRNQASRGGAGAPFGRTLAWRLVGPGARIRWPRDSQG